MCTGKKSCNIGLDLSWFDFEQPDCENFDFPWQNVYFMAICEG